MKQFAFFLLALSTIFFTSCGNSESYYDDRNQDYGQYEPYGPQQQGYYQGGQMPPQMEGQYQQMPAQMNNPYQQMPNQSGMYGQQNSYASQYQQVIPQGSQSDYNYSSGNTGMDYNTGMYNNDKSHSDFIKAMREVENYSDGTGTYEMSSHYDNVWSKNDGSTFVGSTNPTFNPNEGSGSGGFVEMIREE